MKSCICKCDPAWFHVFPHQILFFDECIELHHLFSKIQTGSAGNHWTFFSSFPLEVFFPMLSSPLRWQKHGRSVWSLVPHTCIKTRITWKWRGLLALGKVQIRNSWITFKHCKSWGRILRSFDKRPLSFLCNWCISSRPTKSVWTKQKLRRAQANVDERYPPQSNLPIFLASKKMCRKHNAQTVQLQSPYLGGGCISTTWEVRVDNPYVEGQLVEHAKKNSSLPYNPYMLFFLNMQTTAKSTWKKKELLS